MCVRERGAVGIPGVNFKYKFCALIFVRMINLGYRFKVACNVQRCGVFHDVFVEYLDDNCRKKNIFMRFKSKKKKPVTMQQLLSERRCGFSLRKHYKSYIQMMEGFYRSEEGVKFEGYFEESLFILYTNADVEQKLKSYNATDFRQDEFLKTGGSVLQFDEEKHPAIYLHLRYLPRHREFLSQFRIYYSQADEREMDSHIKPELQQSMKLPEIQLDIAYMYFYEYISDWCHNSRFFLQDTNSRENDPLRNTSEYLRRIFGAKNRIRGNPNLTNSI